MPSVRAGLNRLGRGTWVAAVAAALGLLGSLAAPQGSAAGGPSVIDLSPPLQVSGSQHLLIPAYFYPLKTAPPGQVTGEQTWHAMCDGLYGLRGAIVLNQDDGKFTAGDQDYKDVLRYCLDRRRTVIGYVHTRITPNDPTRLRPLGQVKANIDAHFREFKGIRGMFVDEMGNDPALRICPKCAMTNDEYYREIYKHVHAKSSAALVVGNPGAAASTDWQIRQGGGGPSADIVVVFEGLESTYASWSPPSWVASSPDPHRFAHLVYGSPSRTATTAACRASAQKGAGSVFVTQSTNWSLPPDSALLRCPTVYRAPPVLAP